MQEPVVRQWNLTGSIAFYVVLHESAWSFSQEVESLGLAGTGPKLAMAWIGKDVNEWHKRIAYRVCEMDI